MLLVTVLIGVTQWRAGAWQAGYGAYPDEPAHFMGGLMIRDFLVSGSHSPVAFAANYYLFQPYFAIGHWPPFFYVMEGIWMLVTGYSRTSLMLLSGLLAMLVGLVLFGAVRRWTGVGLALAVTGLFLAIPSVQWSACVVMSDLCVALLSLVATLAIGRFIETSAWRWALLAGVFAALALLTKYLAAFVLLPPILLIAVDRRFDLLRKAGTWLFALIVAALCAPWLVWSRRFPVVGLDVPRGDLWSRLARVSDALHSDFGNVLGGIALMATFWAVLRWRRMNTTQRLLVLQLPCMAAFLILGPQADMERRYLLPSYPGVLATTALAVHWIAMKQRTVGRLLVLALACLVGVGLAVNRIGLPTNFPRLIARDLLPENPTAILVPGTKEGPMIAELASAEPVRSRILLIRPSKLLARVSWSAVQYQLLVPDVKAMKSILDRYPIGVIVMAVNRDGADLPHDRLLREMLASDPVWILQRRYAEPGVDWQIYRRPVDRAADAGSLESFVRSHLPSIQ